MSNNHFLNAFQKFNFIYKTFSTEAWKKSSTIYALSSGHGKCGLEARKAYLKNIRHPTTNEIIDKGLCLWFPAPHSFTGEDSVEFQVHGGTAILSALMLALSKLGFRPALAAYIDFGEEENIETETFKVCNSDLIDLSNKIQKHLLDDRKGEILRNGIKSIILGEPNVGKSSLLNHLVNRNAAIVTSIPGTTRDIVELTANIAGYPILLADTAGINRNTTDIIEKEGIKRAKDQAKMADFIMLVIDASKYKASNQTFKEYLSNYVKSLELECLLLEKNNLVNNCIIILNKIDLLNEVDRKNVQKQNVISISCANEEGFEKLLEKMSEKFEAICGNPTAENPTIEKNYDVVLAAQEIRKAARELGKITGHVSTEEILDIIFKNFCIGK
ncbi:hypothetical protein TKK_0001983 [Trichogramma kaykai]